MNSTSKCLQIIAMTDYSLLFRRHILWPRPHSAQEHAHAARCWKVIILTTTAALYKLSNYGLQSSDLITGLFSSRRVWSSRLKLFLKEEKAVDNFKSKHKTCCLDYRLTDTKFLLLSENPSFRSLLFYLSIFTRVNLWPNLIGDYNSVKLPI